MPAVDSVSSFASNGTGPFTWSHTCSGSDRFLIVGIAHYDSGDSVSGVTYDGVAMTAVPLGATSNGTSYLCFITLYYLIAPNTGTHDIVVSVTGGVFDFGAGATSYTDVHQTTPLGPAATAIGTSTTPSVTVSSAVNEIVFDSLSIIHDGTLSVGADQTQRWNSITPNGYLKYAGSTENGAASTTMSWANSNSQTWAIAAVSIKPVGGGGGSSIVPIQAYYRRRRAA